MGKTGIPVYLGAAAVVALFALLAYGSVQKEWDSGAHYSPATTETETKVCPARCHYYSVGSGEGRVDVDCEVAKRFVGKESAYCSGIESYTMDREKVCACPAVKAS